MGEPFAGSGSDEQPVHCLIRVLPPQDVLVVPCFVGGGHLVQGRRAKACAASQRRFGVEEGCEHDQKRPFPAPARLAALRVRAEMRHLRPVDSASRQFSKTLTDPLVCETIGERIGLRQARYNQIATIDSRHWRVVANDLAVVQQSSQVALHLVEQILVILGGLAPCAKKELNGVHRFGFEVRLRRRRTVDAWTPV